MIGHGQCEIAPSRLLSGGCNLGGEPCVAWQAIVLFNPGCYSETSVISRSSGDLSS